MDLRQLRTLVAIVDHRSFAAAGEAVGLTQSAVSLQVKALEESLGVSLFDRTKRPPEPTLEGRRMADRAREILALADQMTGGRRGDSTEGVLELGAVPTVITGVLPPVLAKLKADQPSLRIRLTSGLSHELEQRVVSGELDAAIGTMPDRVKPGLSIHSFADEPLVVIAPPGTEAASDEVVLSAYPYIRFRRHAWAGQLIDLELSRRGIAPDSVMDIDQFEGIAALVAAGLGASVVPQRPIPHPFPEGVVAIPFGKPQVSRTLAILERANNPRALQVKAVLETLVAECASLS
ncbi:MAG: LysR substrate-binding domain-containing protein [Alphaproteobacteria bacterium]|nr:LysR substrate-binding domain-containing protein [Alphaproteobacteria bacterium]